MEFGIYKVLKNTELEFEYMEFGIWDSEIWRIIQTCFFMRRALQN